MCGRFNNHVEHMHGWHDLLVDWPDVQCSYNVAPTRQVCAFVGPRGQGMRWGLVPRWARQFESGYATFNARVETVQARPSFRAAWKNQQRCLIPMAGYYEWQGARGNKQPFYITDPDINGLVVAGLYELWGEDQYSCTILTTAANEPLGQIHARMPIMLTPETARHWLSGIEKEALLKRQVPDVIYYPVGKAVGNTRNDDPGLIEALA